MIHRFKYSGEWQIAYNMGRWYGAELKASGLYDDVDLVIPIPLHYIKILKRGYNQSTYLAEGIAKSLGAKVDTRATRRIRNNPSQARRGARDRWENVDKLFHIVHPERLRGKHILVVDDVLTSGATLTTFLKEVTQTIPDCRISIATLAVTKHITPLGK
jgi:predicted amidophosphoribosyltransferase